MDNPQEIFDQFHRSQSKSKSTLNKKLKDFIGKHVIIVSNPRITPELYKRSFPDGIFGRIIGYDVRKGFELRSYAFRKRSKRNKYNKGRHPHLFATPNRLKFID